MLRLFNDDCLSKETLDSIEDNSIDIVFTSPPYNLGNSNYFGEWYSEKFEESAKYKNKSDADNRSDWAEWLIEFVRAYIEKAEYVFLNLQSLSSNKKDIHKILYHLNDYYCDKIIWDKGSGIPHGRNSRVMTATFEEIFIFSKKPSKRVGTKEWFGTMKNLFKMSGNTKNKYSKIHKAMFPIELPKFIIENFVKENGVVCDPFMGLGTTGIAAVETGRDFIGVELDNDYYKIAEERILKRLHK